MVHIDRVVKEEHTTQKLLPGGYRFLGRKYAKEVTEGYILPVKKKELPVSVTV
jgi:hypothetical protein